MCETLLIVLYLVQFFDQIKNWNVCPNCCKYHQLQSPKMSSMIALLTTSESESEYPNPLSIYCTQKLDNHQNQIVLLLCSSEAPPFTPWKVYLRWPSCVNERLISVITVSQWWWLSSYQMSMQSKFLTLCTLLFSNLWSFISSVALSCQTF